MTSTSSITIRFLITMLVSALLFTGCSNSSDSNTDGAPLSADNMVVDTGVDNVTASASSESEEANSTEASSETVLSSDVEELSIPDPLTQNSTLVDFSITVPAYQSSALQVRLTWDDNAFNASWIGDELWTATASFPTNTEHLLVVTFSDANGEVTLASYEAVFKTGINDSESYLISVEQFNTDQWDSDEDGIPNLNESIAGTGPLVDEDSTLSIIDYYNLGGSTRSPISHAFESRVTEARPFFDTFEPAPDSTFPGTISGAVDIDATGNGTLTYHYSLGIGDIDITGVRTHSENTISWEGVRNDHDGDFTDNENYTSTITLIDENTRDFVEELLSSNSGTYFDTWDTSTDLRGELVDGTSLCKPVAGTVLQTHRSNRTQPETETVITISKETDDQYWRVVRVKNGDVTSEYFVRELRMLAPISASSSFDPERAYFKCDFVDF